MGGDRKPQWRAGGGWRGQGEPGLRHVHVRIHGQAEGRDGDARGPGQLSALGGGGIRREGGRGGAGTYVGGIRPDGDESAGAADGRGDGGDGGGERGGRGVVA